MLVDRVVTSAPWFKKLESNKFDGRLVRVVRRFGRSSNLEGFPVRHSSEAITLVLVDWYRFDGFGTSRVEDVVDVVPASKKRTEFVKRSFDVQGRTWSDVPWGGAGLLDPLRWCLEVDAGLVSIAKEETLPKELYVGLPTKLGRTSARVKEIATTGHWWGETYGHRLSEITRVEVGGPYGDMLLAVNASIAAER